MIYESKKSYKKINPKLANQEIFFEKLDIFSFFRFFVKERNLNKVNLLYIDASKTFLKFLVFIRIFFKISFEKLDFELIEIKDSTSKELIRERISRVDLFEFEKKLKSTEEFKKLLSLQLPEIDYILKGVTDFGILQNDSISRIIFLIEVINIKKNMQKPNLVNFYIYKRPWINILTPIAKEYEINLVPSSLAKRNFQAQEYPKLYYLVKFTIGLFSKKKSAHNKNNLYIDGRGDLNLEDNGLHSDLFWYLNSDFPLSNIIAKKINSSKSDISFPSKKLSFKAHFKNHKYFRSSSKNLEMKVINRFLRRYKTLKLYWQNFFEENKVKIYLSWNKYDNTHFAISDAINSIGGISCIYQLAYDGNRAMECRLKADISFIFSKLSSEEVIQDHSKSHYQIITGYTKSYAQPLLASEAKKIRKNIFSNGATKIIAAFDENNGEDSRWHTGEKLQQENYIYLLNELFKDNSLGLVFKPKHGKTLRDRLGNDVYQLLEQAKKTGRCIVLDDFAQGTYASSAPPMLAALSSDLCIHGHLGTAAMECALIGKPTFLIDREIKPFSNFYEYLEKEYVIFKNWESAIEAYKEYFKHNKQIIKFGDWSNMLVDLDPFQDDKGAARMGSYLNNLRLGFELGLDKQNTMERATILYSKEWGANKVIISSA